MNRRTSPSPPRARARKAARADGPLPSSSPSSPPATPSSSLLIIDLLFTAAVLDAVDLTALACCSRELRTATSAFWAGYRSAKGNNPTYRLAPLEKKKVVPLAADNEYAPISAAGPCAACGDGPTRFVHPVCGALLCHRCGTKSETAGCWSALSKYRMMDELAACKRFCLAPKEGGDALARLLTNCARTAVVTTCYTGNLETGRPLRTVSYTRYAPYYVADAKEALAAYPRPVGGVGGGGGEAAPQPFVSIVPLPTAGGDDDEGRSVRVFLRHEVVALMLARFGGPRLLAERMRNLAIGPLDLANPDA